MVVVTSEGSQAASAGFTDPSRWSPTASPSPSDVEKHFRAFVAEVYQRHGYGPTLGQSHTPCDLCRSIDNARAFLGLIR